MSCPVKHNKPEPPAAAERGTTHPEGGPAGVYYHEYLGLDKVLTSQNLESAKTGPPAHDEHLFIVIHQVSERMRAVMNYDDMYTSVLKTFIQDVRIGMQILQKNSSSDYFRFFDHKLFLPELIECM